MDVGYQVKQKTWLDIKETKKTGDDRRRLVFASLALSLSGVDAHKNKAPQSLTNTSLDNEKQNKNTGDEPEHRDPSKVEFYVARVGYQVYCEYQKQLLTDIDGEPVGEPACQPASQPAKLVSIIIAVVLSLSGGGFFWLEVRVDMTVKASQLAIK